MGTDAMTSNTGVQEMDDGNDGNRLYEIVLNCFYLIVSTNSEYSQFTTWIGYLFLIIEDAQMISWAFSQKLAIQYLPAFVNTLLDVFEYRGPDGYFDFGKFKIVFGLVSGSIVLMLALFLYIIQGCKTGDYDRMKSLKLLGFLLYFLPGVLFMPALNTLLSGISCSKSLLNDFRAVSCMSSDHMPIFIAGILIAVLFVPFAAMARLFYFEQNPTFKAPHAKCTGRVDAYYTIVKTVICIVWKFGYPFDAKNSSLNALLVISTSTVLPATVAFSILSRYPYFNPNVNHVRFSFLFAATICNFLSFGNILAAFTNSPDKSNGTSIALLVLIIPLLLTGILVSKKYLEHLNGCIRRKMGVYRSTSSLERSLILVFPRSSTVEIAARIVTRQMDEKSRMVEYENDLETFNLIFEYGLKEFPNNFQLMALHAMYLNQLSGVAKEFSPGNHEGLRLKMMKSYQKACNLRSKNPPWDIDFQIFYLQRTITQSREVSELGHGVKMDLASYSSYQRLVRVADTNRNEAFRNLVYSWKALLNPSFDPAGIIKYCRVMHESKAKADRAFTELIGKYPKSCNLLRQYAKFLIEVGNQPYKGKNLLMKAEALENKGHTLDDKKGPKLELDGKAEIENDNHSSSAAGTAVELRKEAEKRNTKKRLEATTRIVLSWLKWVNILSLAVSVALFISNIAVSWDIFANGNVKILNKFQIHEREYLTAEFFHCARNMQLATRDKDSDSYEYYQARLRDKLQEFLKINRDLFFNRNRNFGPSQKVYTKPIANATFSYLPYVEEKHTSTLSLFDITNEFLARAIIFSNYEFGMFGSGADGFEELGSNPNFRFILDNFKPIQKPYKYSSDDAFMADIEQHDQSSLRNFIILTSIQVAVLFIILVLVDKRVRGYYDEQTESLRLLKSIPKRNVKKMIAELFYADDDFENGNEDGGERGGAAKAKTNLNAEEIEDVHEDEKPGLFDGVFRYRFRFLLFFLAVSGSICAFLVSNLNGLYYFGQRIVVMNQLGDTLSAGFSSSVLAQEIFLLDESTWNSHEEVTEFFGSMLSDFDGAHETVLYGDNSRWPPGIELKELPDKIQRLFEPGACLTLNETWCDQKMRFYYNETAGYGERVGNGGLEAVTRQASLNLFVIKAATAGGAVEALPKNLDFLSIAMLYDFPEGYLKAMLNLLDDTSEHINTLLSDNLAICIVFFATVLVGYILVFQYMLSSMERRSNQIQGLFLHIPQDILKIAPSISHYMRTGRVNAKYTEDIMGIKVDEDESNNDN